MRKYHYSVVTRSNEKPKADAIHTELSAFRERSSYHWTGELKSKSFRIDAVENFIERAICALRACSGLHKFHAAVSFHNNVEHS